MSPLDHEAGAALLRRLRHLRGTLRLLSDSTSVGQDAADAIDGMADRVEEMVESLAAIVEPGEVAA